MAALMVVRIFAVPVVYFYSNQNVILAACNAVSLLAFKIKNSVSVRTRPLLSPLQKICIQARCSQRYIPIRTLFIL